MGGLLSPQANGPFLYESLSYPMLLLKTVAHEGQRCRNVSFRDGLTFRL